MSLAISPSAACISVIHSLKHRSVKVSVSSFVPIYCLDCTMSRKALTFESTSFIESRVSGFTTRYIYDKAVSSYLSGGRIAIMFLR